MTDSTDGHEAYADRARGSGDQCPAWSFDPVDLTRLIGTKISEFVSPRADVHFYFDGKEGLVQDAVLHVMSVIHRHDPRRSSFKTFVARAVENFLIDVARRNELERRNPDRAVRPASQSEQGLQDLQIDLAEAIRKLGHRDQQLVRDLQHWPVHEVAKRHGVHRGTIHRRVEQIRHRWNDEGLRAYLES